ncbi:hypothetical protein J437_LFUL010750 [Ladona fulva]|uniref:Reverse transcriptase RNase H-like domain-containing protein n=1 Tax=Ladona fulva TaxID=123851 RepID=A0A8K0KBB6_LADFU|nr:hypothetical protein J437_LFUL010750 [Ladona fulva]
MTLGPDYFSFHARPDCCWPYEKPVYEQDAGLVDASLQSLFNESSSTSNSSLNEGKDQWAEFHLFVGASHLALVAVLNHEIDGKFVPVAYASKTLNPHEQKLSSCKLQCMACTWAVDKFKEYIQVMPFHPYTDNGAFTWLFSHPKQLGKIGHMVLKLPTYKFTVHHVKGNINLPTDCLSHVTFNQPFPESGITCFLHKVPLSFVDIRAHQKQDPFCLDLLKKLSSLKLSVFKVNGRSLSPLCYHSGQAPNNTGEKATIAILSAIPMMLNFPNDTPDSTMTCPLWDGAWEPHRNGKHLRCATEQRMSSGVILPCILRANYYYFRVRIVLLRSPPASFYLFGVYADGIQWFTGPPPPLPSPPTVAPSSSSEGNLPTPPIAPDDEDPCPGRVALPWCVRLPPLPLPPPPSSSPPPPPIPPSPPFPDGKSLLNSGQQLQKKPKRWGNGGDFFHWTTKICSPRINSLVRRIFDCICSMAALVLAASGVSAAVHNDPLKSTSSIEADETGGGVGEGQPVSTRPTDTEDPGPEPDPFGTESESYRILLRSAEPHSLLLRTVVGGRDGGWECGGDIGGGRGGERQGLRGRGLLSGHRGGYPRKVRGTCLCTPASPTARPPPSLTRGGTAHPSPAAPTAAATLSRTAPGKDS